MLRRLLPVVCFTAVAGCSNNNSQGGQPDLAAAPDLAMEACLGPGGSTTLPAHIGVKAALNVNVKVPADCSGDSCILDQDELSPLWLLADIEQMGDMVKVTAHPCSIKIPPVVLNQNTTAIDVPDSLLVAHLAPIVTQATLTEGGACTTLGSDPLALVIGAHLANPSSDPLPVFQSGHNPPVKLCDGAPTTDCGQTMDTACICDQDQDGHIAASVGVSGLPALDNVDKLYLALRTVITLQGTLYPSSSALPTPGLRMRGTVDNLQLEQSPVGCQHDIGPNQMPDCTPAEVGPVAALNPKITPSVNTPSTFVAVPVPDTETCAQLVADDLTLFGSP